MHEQLVLLQQQRKNTDHSSTKNEYQLAHFGDSKGVHVGQGEIQPLEDTAGTANQGNNLERIDTEFTNIVNKVKDDKNGGASQGFLLEEDSAMERGQNSTPRICMQEQAISASKSGAQIVEPL